MHKCVNSYEQRMLEMIALQLLPFMSQYSPGTQTAWSCGTLLLTRYHNSAHQKSELLD